MHREGTETLMGLNNTLDNYPTAVLLNKKFHPKYEILHMDFASVWIML